MWFWLSLTALLFWSGSDLFSKLGCRDPSDRNSHLKMLMAVGLVMGIHALIEVFFVGVEISIPILLKYLPVSIMYILSMALGYLGLRYIELSISSPICNASGAIVAILALITGDAEYPFFLLLAIAFVCIGVIGLGIVEANEDTELRAARQNAGNYRYAKSWLALALPVAYCLLDAAGTFADNIVLESINESSANVAYELTFLFVGILSFIYIVLIRKEKLIPQREGLKYLGALCETAGQFAYIYAIADSEHLALSAPIISSYCIVSVIWSRIFLREKLSYKHYIMIVLVAIGIIIMGVFDV